ncbi:MAG: WYL domain-containing protein, partial [Clostridia bacterium]|nr:WYL domain-containing protein [Clostridia bacterium]
MESLEPKKLLLLRILQILESHSDVDHPLRQKDIMRLLHNEYDMDCERKAVGRNIAFLERAGYDIEHADQGVYLGTRAFEAGELRLLSDAVLCSRHISAKHTKDLVNKLSELGGCGYRPYRPSVVRLDDWQKTSNQ